MRVLVVCQNLLDDRIIPRMARALHERLGWDVTAGLGATVGISRRGMPVRTRQRGPEPDVVYLSAYFEALRCKGLLGTDRPAVAAYFTHYEEQPAGNEKAKLFLRVAGLVGLRVVTCAQYGKMLKQFGPVLRAAAPVDQKLFTIEGPQPGGLRHKARRPVVGLSGYTYSNHRKGEDLVRGMIGSGVGARVEWRASGRGWPVPTVRYPWARMAEFYRGLDVLVVPSRVEGIPMPPLEALACGKRVVIPRGVGMLDELPEVEGIHRYERGDLRTLIEALEAAAFPARVAEPEALRAAVKRYSVEAWCEDHRKGFERIFGTTKREGDEGEARSGRKGRDRGE